MTTSRSLPSGRIEGLDGWRAGLMIGGLFLHAASWQQSRPLFEAIALFSHTFRMGAFFAVSGFLAARALTGRSPATWLRRRVVQIGIPGAFGLAVLCPLITLLVSRMPGQHVTLSFNWYHLWFLVALLLYAPLALITDAIDRRSGRVEALSRPYCAADRSLMPLLIMMGMLSLLLLLLSSFVIGTIGTAETMPVLSAWRSIAGYAPDYLLGFAAARSVGLQAAMMRDWRSPTLVLSAVTLSYLVWFQLVASRCPVDARLWGDGLLPLIGAALAPSACFALILRSSAYVRDLGRPLRLLADGSFTIYLIHLPITAALSLILSGSGWNTYLQFTLIVVATAILSLAFFRFLVRPSAWMSLLFCGQPLKRRHAGKIATLVSEPPRTQS